MKKQRKPNIIHICNINNRFDVYKLPSYTVDRTTPLGNPHYITALTSRNEAIRLYERDFETILKEKPGAKELFDEIYNSFLGSDINLFCHCAPLACHARVIANKLIERFRNDNSLQNEQ